MNIIPWRRADSVTSLTRDFDDLVSQFLGNGGLGEVSHLPAAFTKRPYPAVNIAENENSFVVSLDCPGLKEEDLNVEAMGNQLIISGERSWEQEKEGKEFRRVESQYGKFERAVELPDNAQTDADSVVAEYKNGVLSVDVPKRAKTPTSKIPVISQ